MATVYVEWSKLRNQSNTLASKGRKLVTYGTRIDDINSCLAFKSNYSNVTRTISNIASGIQKQAGIMQKMGTQLQAISNAYGKTEMDITGKGAIAIKEIKGTIVGPIFTPMAKKDSEKFDWKWSSLIWKNVAKMGVTGNAIAAFGEMLTGGVTAKTLIGGGSKFATIVGDLAKNAYSDNPSIKEVVFGDWKKGSAVEKLKKWAKIPETTVTTKWGVFTNSMKKQASEFLPSSCKNVGDKIKLGTKWAGVALSGVTNAISNKKEMETGGISKGRAVAETVMETAVDVGIGMVATAAATALIGASAPAVAVGAAAAGVVWAADAATRYLTKKNFGSEKGLTEFLSDTVLDTAEAVVNTGKNAAKAIANGAKKAVGKAVQNIGKTFVKWSFT